MQKDRLDDRAEQVRREAVALGRLRATFNPMLDLLPMVALVTVLYVGGKDAIDGTLTVGDMVAFSFLLLQLVFPLRMTSYIVAQVARATASAARVQEVMVTEPQITDDDSPPALPPGPGAVSFSGRSLPRTTAAATCCATSISRSRAASRSRWSGRPAAARARWRA